MRSSFMLSYLNLVPDAAWFAALIPVLLTFCAAYKKIKDSEMFQDIFGLYQHFKSKEILELEQNLNTIYLSKEDKVSFQYELIVAILQRNLKTQEQNLSLLRYFKSLIHSHYAARIHNNCHDLVKFNEANQSFELIKEISKEEAKKSENIGAALFATSGILAYCFVIFMLFFVNTGIDFKKHIGLGILWGCINLLFMFIIIYIGSRILKYFMRKSNALKLLSLPKKKLDVSPEDSQPIKEDD